MVFLCVCACVFGRSYTILHFHNKRCTNTHTHSHTHTNKGSLITDLCDLSLLATFLLSVSWSLIVCMCMHVWVSHTDSSPSLTPSVPPLLSHVHQDLPLFPLLCSIVSAENGESRFLNCPLEGSSHRSWQIEGCECVSANTQLYFIQNKSCYFHAC